MKNILITGASKGIGYATATLLAQKPNHQIITLSRNTSQLLDLKANTPNLFPFAFDLSNFDEKIITAIKSQFGEIHVLINNAGYLVKKPFEQLTDQDWQDSFEVNVFGVVKLIKSLMPCMGKTKRTHILNIGSMGGFQGAAKFAGLSAYSASKAALANLTETLAAELSAKNITVNCLALGSVQTEMFDEAFPNATAALQTHEIAEYIAWFALNGHSFHQGKVIPVAMSTP